jgi:IS605 OrfB family transposase
MVLGCRCRRIRCRHDGSGGSATPAGAGAGERGQGRDRYRSRAEAAADVGDTAAARAAAAKARRIERNNLGHEKLSAQRAHDRAVTKDAVYQAVHDLVDTTAHVVAEDLAGLRGKSKFGRTASRVYAAWQRSFLADALASVPSRRGSAVTLVNPAYTSQQVHSCGHLGVRRGKNVYCQTAGCPQQGIVFDTEINAARVIRDRATDPQITRYTPKHEVRQISDWPGRDGGELPHHDTSHH